MTTARVGEEARRESEGYRAEALGERATGLHDETKWSLLTTEFWAMLVVILVILIATAVSDSLNDTRAWLLVTVVATGYIVSRGIAKAGTGHLPVGASRRRT
jgi:Ca2+/H+ antiporter